MTNTLPKHSLIFPSQIQNRACFRPCPSCLQSVAQSGAMEFPFGETGRRTNPFYRNNATSYSPQVCNKLSWVAYWGTEKGTVQFRQGFCLGELLHNKSVQTPRRRGCGVFQAIGLGVISVCWLPEGPVSTQSHYQRDKPYALAYFLPWASILLSTYTLYVKAWRRAMAAKNISTQMMKS